MAIENKVYIHYNPENGDLLGFYETRVHGDNIPTPNIEITEEKRVWLQETGFFKLNIVTKELEQLPAATPEATPEDLDAAFVAGIEAATTIAGLKAALLGKNGLAKVKAERK